MSFSLPSRSWLLPTILALPFVVVPPLLFHFYPVPFWTAGEAEWIGLADALNLAYRLRDLKMYSALGLAGHPGVPFYVMSWLALALSGLPIATRGEGFFNAVLGRLVEYQTLNIWLAAMVGAAGIFIFTREARKLVPAWVIAAGLLLWVSSTPWTLISFVSPANESFGMLINALFLLALVRIANDEDFLPQTTILAASVSAFAYLNKLSFINVGLALAVASAVAFLARGASMRQCARSMVLFNGVCFGIIFVVGILIIGWDEFLYLLRFHKNVILGSGLYGDGDQFVVAGSKLLDAVRSIPAHKVYCLAIAPVLGALLIAGGCLTVVFRRKELPAAVIAIGAGTAAVLATASVLKHYDAHYSSAVSPTLPACLVAGYLLANAWNLRARAAWAIMSIVAIALMTRETAPAIVAHFNGKIAINAAAMADLKDIKELPLGNSASIAFTYSAPFAYFGEGFVIYLACVPRLTAEYHRERPRMFSTAAADSPPRKIDAIVLHKDYFPTADSIRTSRNLAMFGGEPLTWREGDKLTELRTVFVLLRGARAQP